MNEKIKDFLLTSETAKAIQIKGDYGFIVENGTPTRASHELCFFKLPSHRVDSEVQWMSYRWSCQTYVLCPDTEI